MDLKAVAIAFEKKMMAKVPLRQRKYVWRLVNRRENWLYRNFRGQLMWTLARLLSGKKPITDLTVFEQMIYSQNGEDGILKAIFWKVGTTNKFCVEFGVGDGTECNTRYLIEREKWGYLHMDMKEAAPLSVRREFITAENVNSVFKKYGVPKEFDLLSIDIDYNTYWVWKAIEGFSPRVVLIEYNSNLGPTKNMVVPYDQTAVWDGTNYFGASLLALVRLASRKGYSLVACDSMGINAFFVRNDLIGGRFVCRSAHQIYRRTHYKAKDSSKNWLTDTSLE